MQFFVVWSICWPFLAHYLQNNSFFLVTIPFRPSSTLRPRRCVSFSQSESNYERPESNYEGPEKKGQDGGKQKKDAKKVVDFFSRLRCLNYYKTLCTGSDTKWRRRYTPLSRSRVWLHPCGGSFRSFQCVARVSQPHPCQRALRQPILDPCSNYLRTVAGNLDLQNPPCCTPGGGAATLASAALHFDIKLDMDRSREFKRKFAM